MKITKSQLKQIIKEELEAVMGGGLASDPDQPRPDEERYLRNAPRGGE